MPTRIVTDSAADLPPELIAEHRIRVVPLTIRFGETTYLSGVDLSTEEFWNKLRASDVSPATAAPSAGDFEVAFRELAADGADGIVSVHLSSKLSATYQAAAVAAQSFGDVPVEVVDTLSVSGATGLAALRGCELAAEGLGPSDIAADLNAMRERTTLYGVIDTLEYLRRGGRIGGAQALLGTMLKVKPVISVVDGVVEPVGRVRTRAKALEHLAGLVKERAGTIDRIIAISGEAPDIDAFLGLLDGVVDIGPSDVWQLGPVVGTHSGPGVVGVVFTTTA